MGWKWADEPATARQRQLLAGLMTEALGARSANERYAVYEYLTGKADSKLMNMAECAALIDWLSETDAAGRIQLWEEAAGEAAAVYRAAMRRQGQLTFEVEGR